MDRKEAIRLIMSNAVAVDSEYTLSTDQRTAVDETEEALLALGATVEELLDW